MSPALRPHALLDGFPQQRTGVVESLELVADAAVGQLDLRDHTREKFDKPGQDESLAPPGTPPVVFTVPDPNIPGATKDVSVPAGSVHYVYSKFVGNDNNLGTKIIYNRYDNYDFSNAAFSTKLSEGFHIALYNQSLFQEKTVINDFPFLNNDTYVGEVKVPIFPTLFAVYKVGDLAISFGFGPNAGGGSADFPDGLPSFEIPISAVPAILASPPYSLPITGY